MNEVIHTLTNHRSIRSYLSKPVPDEYIQAIVKAAQAPPSWINGQQVSIVCITDRQKKRRLAEIVGHQSHVDQAPVFFVFCADFYRTKIAAEMENEPLEVVHNIDALLVGATDVGLALGNAIAAAESLGLGIVPIGGIRRTPLEVIDLLDLPTYVLPVSGLCIGYPADIPQKKPRFDQQAIFHHDTYEHELQEGIEAYNKKMEAYTSEQSKGKKSDTWSKRVAGFYNKQYYKDVPEMLKKQGFTFKNI